LDISGIKRPGEKNQSFTNQFYPGIYNEKTKKLVTNVQGQTDGIEGAYAEEVPIKEKQPATVNKEEGGNA
jgi:hypothetical protein